MNIKVPKPVVIYEMILGMFEILGGLLIGLFNHQIALLYANHRVTDWLESSNFLFAKFADIAIDKFGKSFVSHQNEIIIVLSLFGISKVVSSIGLLYEREWAGHLLIIILTILVPFEFISLLIRFSIATFAYLIVNILIIFYLVKFKPIHYYTKVGKYIRGKTNDKPLP